MQWYRQDIVNSIDHINEIINEIEQIQEDILEEDKDYRSLEISRLKLIDVKDELKSIIENK